MGVGLSLSCSLVNTVSTHFHIASLRTNVFWHMLGRPAEPQLFSHWGVQFPPITSLSSHSVRMHIFPWFLFSPSHWLEEQLIKSFFFFLDLGMQSSYFKDWESLELTRITTRVYKRDKRFLVWVFTALLGLKLNSDIMVGLQKAKASKNIKEGKKGKALSQKSRVQRRN